MSVGVACWGFHLVGAVDELAGGADGEEVAVVVRLDPQDEGIVVRKVRLVLPPAEPVRDRWQLGNTQVAMLQGLARRFAGLCEAIRRWTWWRALGY